MDTKNREIKFRAWDKRLEKMYGGFGHERAFEQEEIIKGFDGNGQIILRDKDCILMQFTGLKDKNEVEIYEGDIVRSDKGGLGKIFWDKEGARFKVEWYKEDKFTHLELLVEACEVIGNIYENPELLTQNQDD